MCSLRLPVGCANFVHARMLWRRILDWDRHRYVGTLEDGTEFDRGDKFKFTIDAGEVPHALPCQLSVVFWINNEIDVR